VTEYGFNIGQCRVFYPVVKVGKDGLRYWEQEEDVAIVTFRNPRVDDDVMYQVQPPYEDVNGNPVWDLPYISYRFVSWSEMEQIRESDD